MCGFRRQNACWAPVPDSPLHQGLTGRPFTDRERAVIHAVSCHFAGGGVDRCSLSHESGKFLRGVEGFFEHIERQPQLALGIIAGGTTGHQVMWGIRTILVDRYDVIDARGLTATITTFACPGM